MFGKKIIWLCCLLPLSTMAAGEEAETLLARARYWQKLGQSERALESWQALQQLEPNNAEARAALAGTIGQSALTDAPQVAPIAKIEIQSAPLSPPEPLSKTESVFKPVPLPRSAPLSASLPGLDMLGAREIVKSLPEESDGAMGGALSPDEHATPEELTARATYWERRGRADLAAKLRPLPGRKAAMHEVSPPPVNPSRATPVAPPVPREAVIAESVPPVVAPVVPLVATAPVVAITPVVPLAPVVTAPAAVEVEAEKPSPEQRAHYWQARGRSDLAGRAERPVVSIAQPAVEAEKEVATPKPDAATRSQYWQARGREDLAAQPATPSAAPVAPSAPVRPAPRIMTAPAAALVEEAPVKPAVPSAQELSDRAQYWESRGRSDLATQLRQQLQHQAVAITRPVQSVAAQSPAGQNAIVRTSSEKVINNQGIEKSSLEDELLKHPGSIKASLDLAQIYRSTGELARSRALIDGVLASHPDLPEALFASANLYAEQQLWPETLFALEKISPVARTPEMAKLQKLAWAHGQLDRADALLREGKRLEAELLLRRVAAELSLNKPERVKLPELWGTRRNRK